MKIGFIGLGNMGKPMALNLLKGGYEVIGFDTVAFTLSGITVANSAAEVASGADVVITMLPNGAILQSVADQVLEVMTEGAILLDCSTVDVDSARNVAKLAEAAGVTAIDAPVFSDIDVYTSRTLDSSSGLFTSQFL